MFFLSPTPTVGYFAFTVLFIPETCSYSVLCGTALKQAIDLVIETVAKGTHEANAKRTRSTATLPDNQRLDDTMLSTLVTPIFPITH
jgi:hypothetical protein